MARITRLRRQVACIGSVVLLAAACGSSTAPESETSGGIDTAQTAATLPIPTTTAESESTPQPEATTSTTVTTITQAPTTTERPDSLAVGELFTDPEGMYDITFDPSWVANHGSLAAEIELWVVGPIADGFAPNVNVLTQLVPELDIDGYIEVSADSSPRFISNFELIDSGIVEGSSGQMLGFMEYLGALGGPLVHALAVFVLADGIAVIATLVALPDDFDELRETIEPLLLTLRRT